MAGKVCRVTKDSLWITEIQNHEGYRLTPMVSPKLCPGAQIEFYLGEFQPGVGRALDHVHIGEDHVFYVLSGRATAKVGNEIYSLEPGDALWVPKGEVHNFDVVGGETFRVIAIFSPPRADQASTDGEVGWHVFSVSSLRESVVERTVKQGIKIVAQLDNTTQCLRRRWV